MGDSSASSVGVGEEGMARRRNRPVRVIRRIHGSIEELVVLCDCETVTVSPLRSSSRETSRGRRFYGCNNYRQGGGCGFFLWEDEVFGKTREVINETSFVENKGDDKGAILKEIKKTNSSIRAIWCTLVLIWLTVVIVLALILMYLW